MAEGRSGEGDTLVVTSRSFRRRVATALLSVSLLAPVSVLSAVSAQSAEPLAAAGQDAGWAVAATEFALAGEQSVTNAKVTWQERADADRYRVYRDGELVGETSGDTLDDYGLDPDTDYAYTVRALAGDRVVATSVSDEVRTFTPVGDAKVWDNTTNGNDLERPRGLRINGTYYDYTFTSTGSGPERTTTIAERTSTDGRTFGPSRELARYVDSKFENAQTVYNRATGNVVIAAHYENGSDYSLAHLYLAEVEPGGALTEGFRGRPLGRDSRDQTIFVDDDGSAYSVSATNTNKDIAIYALNESWTAPTSLVNLVFEGARRETPEIVQHEGSYYFFGSRASGWYPSQAMYASTTDLAGEWTELRQLGNAATFGTQSTGIGRFGTDRATHGMYGWRWGANFEHPEPTGNHPRLLPVTFNEGFATLEYFPTVRVYEDAGLVPVQAGRNLSTGADVAVSTAAATNGDARVATDGADLASSGYFKSGAYPYDVVIDLGSAARLSEINTTTRLVTGSETAYSYTIEGSLDGGAYTTLVDGTQNKRTGFLLDKITDDGEYRYLRLTVKGITNVHNGNSATWADGLIEVAAFGHPAEDHTAPELGYTGVPVGEPWLDTDGQHIQAHGGGFLEHDGWFYWVGENKEHNKSSFLSVNLYRSKDLLNWEFVNRILTADSATGGDAPRLATGQVKVERPKLLYNEATDKFVLWGHWETADSYRASRLVVATSDTIDGLYTYVDDFRPGEGEVWDLEQERAIQAKVDDGTHPTFEESAAAYAAAGNTPKGHQSRDFTVYQDPDSDAAYLISAEAHHHLRLYPLGDDYLTADHERSYPLFEGESREATAIVKADGLFYLFTSGQSGWYANQLKYAYTDDISSPEGWSKNRNVGNNTTFKSQPTNIMDIPRTDGSGSSYVYMGDRWTPSALGGSSYVWLPLQIGDNPATGVELDYADAWALDAATGEFGLPDVELVSEGKPATATAGTASQNISTGFKDANGATIRDGYTDPAILDNPAAAANDGIVDTTGKYDNTHYYKSSGSAPYSWQVDLGKATDLARLDISWRSYNGSETYSTYSVFGSTDGSTWERILDREGNREVGFTSDRLSGKHRHVKITVSRVVNDHNGNSAFGAAGLVEVQVYKSTGGSSASTVDTAVQVTATAGRVSAAVALRSRFSKAAA